MEQRVKGFEIDRVTRRVAVIVGVKIVFRVGLVLLKQMLGSVDKLREVQGMYETMERLRNISPDTIREDVLVQEVRLFLF